MFVEIFSRLLKKVLRVCIFLLEIACRKEEFKTTDSGFYFSPGKGVTKVVRKIEFLNLPGL